MMRVAALGFHHESNTFAPVPASLARFLEAGPVEGDGLVGEHGTADTTLAGFLAAGAADPDVELVPLVHFDLNPMGTITAEAFEHISRSLLVALGERGPWDAVLLAMHGAAVSEGFPDADGEMVRRVRHAVGGDVVIGVAYDMHANVTEAMVHHADLVNTYLTNPHVDARQRAAQLAAQVFDVARGSIRPCSALVRIPIAVNILRQGTSDVPMRQLMEEVRSAEALPGVLSVSLAEGFPYADVAEMGMSVIAVTDDDVDLAASVASGIAREVWANRQQLQGDRHPDPCRPVGGRGRSAPGGALGRGGQRGRRQSGRLDPRSRRQPADGRAECVRIAVRPRCCAGLLDARCARRGGHLGRWQDRRSARTAHQAGRTGDPSRRRSIRGSGPDPWRTTGLRRRPACRGSHRRRSGRAADIAADGEHQPGRANECRDRSVQPADRHCQRRPLATSGLRTTRGADDPAGLAGVHHR